MERTNHIMAVMLLVVLSAAAFAQSSREAAEMRLAQVLVGKNVTVKIDMPATNKGVEIVGGRVEPEKNRKRLDNYGTAIKSGAIVTITGIRLDGNKLSFELAGGGAPEINIDRLVGLRPEGTTYDIVEARARMQVNSSTTPEQAGNSESMWKYRSAQRRQADTRREIAYQTRRVEAREAARLAAARQGSRFTVKISGVDLDRLVPGDIAALLKGYVAL